MTLAPGSRLGPYEVVSALGAGGMGEVWKARDTRLDRIVAIKRLTQHSERFEQEARAIAALNHPHICQIYDVGPDYLVLEYIEGAPLRGARPAADAVRLAIQIAAALEEAHARGILHRDLKPANVMVTSQGAAKLLDFGLAKLLDVDADVTRTLDGTVVGTAAYMSPEQAEGKPLDARSDIFSFGAVLYEMLSGERAFAGQTSAQVVTAILRDDPPALQAPAGLERIVRRCLHKASAQRFQTMADVRAALEQLAAKPPDLQPSIAVLPFANMSGDKDNEYFSDGLAEEIINALTRIPGLKVIARTSAFAFKASRRHSPDRRGPGRHNCPGRQRPRGRQSASHHGAAHHGGRRKPPVVGAVRSGAGRRFRGPGRDRRGHHGCTAADVIRASGEPRRRHTPTLPAYEHFLKALYDSQKRTPESMERAQKHSRAGDRARSAVCVGARGIRPPLLSAWDLRADGAS